MIHKKYLPFREILWPIARSELRIFIPMALIMFLLVFNFGTLRSIKDSLVIPLIGAEVISFLKLWLVFPIAIFFTLIYVSLSNRLRFEYLFYIILSVFTLFFLIFAYVIYPNQHLWHPAEGTINQLSLNFPHLQWIIKIAGKWSYALIYIFADLWSVIVVNLLFWQFANQLNDTEKAKRFYPIFGMLGNFGMILAGNILIHFANVHQLPSELITIFAPSATHETEITLKLLILAVSVCSILSMIALRYIAWQAHHSARTDAVVTEHIDDTPSLSFKESLKLIYSSKYIGYIAVIVLCYSLAINLLEGPWKAKVRELYLTPKQYIEFMGRVNIWMGVACMVGVVIGSSVIRWCNWKTAAYISPLLIGSTGLVFFLFMIFSRDNHANSIDFITITVVVGTLQNIFSKAAKYSLFDATKEMAYIPLSIELRSKGKAAVEVIGSKVGKSLSAFIQSSIFIIHPGITFDAITIHLTIVFVIVLTTWMISINKLNKEYLKILT